MAFLLLDPTKMQNKGTGSNYHNELRDAFQLALKDKSMDNLRMCLQQSIAIILEKSQEKLKTKQTVSLLSNFTVNELDEYNEVIQRLKEVLHQFSCHVPKYMKDAFENICQEKRIPAMDDKGNDKEFFVISEIKTMREICDALSEEQVCQMYNKLMTKNYISIIPSIKKPTGKTLSELEVISFDLKKIKGMKETSFYCFVVGLSKEGLLNRADTHHLYNYLENEHETDVASHFKSALNMYPLASKPPGVCIIFNVEKDRKGAEKDIAKVDKLFRKTFKYDVVQVKYPMRQDVNKIIEELKADRNKFYDR
ncbi:hypothetical protein GWK47_030953 [Chionoecetes opilio]|uniref:Peptidase C14 caspase domain-containing protein n=1 Tax=Chionoecetes opilio TaxID=41210 RepID=A0A8J4YLA5_CHIOP|nr:hypothetical protein GWK47_030953 [Chionoecetes opilio]